MDDTMGFSFRKIVLAVEESVDWGWDKCAAGRRETC